MENFMQELQKLNKFMAMCGEELKKLKETYPQKQWINIRNHFFSFFVMHFHKLSENLPSLSEEEMDGILTIIEELQEKTVADWGEQTPQQLHDLAIAISAKPLT